MSNCYTDGTPLNANITVDYLNKKVNFSYNYGKDSAREKYMAIFLSFFQFFLIIGFLCFFAFLLIFNFVAQLIFKIPDEIVALIGVNLGVFYFIFFLLISIVISKHVFKNYDRYKVSFPKFNAWYLGLIIRKKKIIFNDINSCFAEIPFFHNVVLEYDTAGEYSDYLEKIYIKGYKYKRIIGTIIRPSRNSFKCIFVFKKIPKTGYLKAFYI